MNTTNTTLVALADAPVAMARMCPHAASLQLSVSDLFADHLDLVIPMICPEVPSGTFAQAIGSVEPAPGDLSPDACRALSERVLAMDDHEMIGVFNAASNNQLNLADTEWQDNVVFVRDLARLAGLAVDHGGLRFS